MPAVAAPVVEIKAQTQLALDKVVLRPDGQASVNGKLVDKLTGEGLGGEQVSVKVGDQTVTAITLPDGKFSVAVPVAPGLQTIGIGFHGGGPLDSAQMTVVTDPTRAAIAIALASEDNPRGATITVLASTDNQPVDVPIELSIGLPAAAQLAPLATVHAGTPFELTRRAAGGTGLRRIHAAFPGDPSRQPAAADLTIELTSATSTSIEVSSKRLAYEDDLTVTGQVRDLEDHPVGHAAVTLTSGDRRLAQGATAGDGSYKLAVEAQIVGTGELGIQVQTDPGGDSLRPSRSAPVIIRVAQPQPVPVSYTVLAFVATALAAGGFFAARTRPWRRLAKLRLFGRAATAPAAASAEAVVAEAHDGGLVVAKPSLMSNLRRATDDGIAGMVCDTVRGRPIADAQINARPRAGGGGAAITTASAADGSFALAALPAGDYTCEVSADGHIGETFAASIPHRGELRGVRVQLVPVRERVFALYRRAAEPSLPEARLWGIWSPRQIVDHVRGKRPSPALADLTDFVEEIYFSGRLSDEAVLPVAAERVDLAVRERIRPPQ